MFEVRDIVIYTGIIPKCGKLNENLIAKNLKKGFSYTIWSTNGSWCTLEEDRRRWNYPEECFKLSKIGFKKKYNLK